MDATKFTEKDYEEMEFEELLKYDKRSYFVKISILLKNENSLASLIFQKSLIFPLHMKIFCFLFDFFIDLGTNAIFYTDEYITKRYENSDDKVKYNY